VSPGWFLFLSLSVHAVLVSILLFYQSNKSKGFPEATTVELVSNLPPSKTLPLPVPVHPAKKAPLPRPVHPVRASRPVPHLQVVKKARIPIVRKRKPIRKIRQKKVLVRPKMVHRLEKKNTSRRKVVSSHPVRVKTAKSSPAPQKPVLHPSRVSNPHPVPVKMDISGQTFPTFLEHLLISRIKSNWFPPPGTRGLRATIQFTLLKDGRVSDQPVVIGSSGNGMFDDAARMAVLRSVPFPPFPPGFSKDQETVTVTLEAIHHGGVLDAR
jgi:protein TonB